MSAGKMIPYDIEYSLAKLFHQEICNQMMLDDIKASIEQRFDYSAQKVYQTINVFDKQFVDEKDLEEFLARNQIGVEPGMLAAAIKRLDLDNDGLVTLSDFRRSLERVQNSAQSYQLYGRTREKEKNLQILEKNFDSCQSYTYTKYEADKSRLENQLALSSHNTPSYANHSISQHSQLLKNL